MHALHLDSMLRPGARIDRYVVEQVLGEGGTAVVVLVHHHRLGTPYALKLLHRRTPNLQERLVAEARMQSRLQHPHIVQVIDVIEHDGQQGIVMELVEGPSLERLLDHRRLELAQVDRLVDQILDGVAHAHSAGVIHRDLKPANVLLAPRAGTLVAKVCDFGIAKSTDGPALSSTRTGSALGTPRYMSPEQIRDAKHVDERTDVFALGTMLYEMVAGVHPFAETRDMWSTMKRVADASYPPLDQHAPHLPDRMRRAIEGALQAQPDDRIPSVAALHATWRGDSQAFVLGWADELLTDAERLKPIRRDMESSDAPTIYPVDVTQVRTADTEVTVETLREDPLPNPVRPVLRWFAALSAVLLLPALVGVVVLVLWTLA